MTSPRRGAEAPSAGRVTFERVPALEALGGGLFAAFSTALPRHPDAGLGERISRALGQGAVEDREHGDHGGRRPFPPPLLLQQVHSAQIVEAPGNGGRGAAQYTPHGGAGADGVVSTLAAGALVAVKTADCVPVLAADPATEEYAALHAGWRGVAAGILPRLLERWRAAGSGLERVVLAMGPHIRQCCFEVGEDCLEQFDPAHLEGAVSREGAGNGRRPHLHLEAVLRRQAARMGLGEHQISVSAHCTRCHVTAGGAHPYASYRRVSAMGEALEDTNTAIIGRRPLPGGG